MTCLPKATCSLEYMMSLCSKKNVCGYSLIDKTYPGHKSMVGFKSLMVKKDLFAKHNISFNLRKLSKRLGLRNQAPTGASKDYLSREVMFNLNLKDNKISPFILGEEGYSKSDKVFGFYDDKDKMQHDSDLMLSYADTTSPQWDHNSKIQMFCMYSQSHEKLYHNVYMKSLNEINDPDIELKPLFIDHYSNGDFTSQGFADMDLYKTQIIINLIKSNYGKVIVFSDADIYWFKPFSHTIKFLMMQNYDCLYTKESNNEEAEDKANIGISVIKCSEKTEKFYKDIYDFYEKVYCSLKEKNLRFQGIVNTLLPKSNLKWCMLPSVFANSSLEYDINDDRLICYHSIGTFPVKNKSSVELKLEQFQKIKKR
jgi:hypothetical protein